RAAPAARSAFRIRTRAASAPSEMTPSSSRVHRLSGPSAAGLFLVRIAVPEDGGVLSDRALGLGLLAELVDVEAHRLLALGVEQACLHALAHLVGEAFLGREAEIVETVDDPRVAELERRLGQRLVGRHRE